MNPSNKPKLIAIVGPTASGKTMLAIDLARRIAAGAEIVSADSRQVYRGMDIGTAKPTPAERAAVPHHLIDIRAPDEDYTVADYQRDAFAAIDDVIARGKTPFIVGGTGLYVRAVVENLDLPKTAADPKLRTEIEADIARDGLAAVFARLVALDPDAESVVDPNNPRRVVRALEVALSTGEPFTAQRRRCEPRYNTLVIGLNPPPGVLRERIDRRVDEMIAAGFADEVAALVREYGPSMPEFNAIGYREMIARLNGATTIDKTAAAIKMDTWHYAKRQLTWFRKDHRTQWLNMTEPNEHAPSLVKRFLTT